MSLENQNPLDRIRKMNADNAAQKEQEDASIIEQEKINQDNIDFEASELNTENKLNEMYPKTTERLLEVEKQVNEEFKIIEIEGIPIPFDKLKYQISLEKKQNLVKEKLVKYQQKYSLLEEDYNNLIESSSPRAQGLISGYGIRGFNYLTQGLSPEAMEGYFNNRDIDKVEELLDSGLERFLDNFKRVMNEIELDENITDTNQVENIFKKEPEFINTYDLLTERNFDYNEHLILSEDDSKKLEKFPKEGLIELIDDVEEKKEERREELINNSQK